MWYEDFDNDDEPAEWCNCYKQRKVLKVKIREELMPISWHLIGMQDCCMADDEKKRINEILAKGKRGCIR